MAQKSSNWIWWTLSGVSFVTLTLGIVLYIRNKRKNTE